ncbi:Alpha/Beta hydrolase protein [Roridomyces roridus]|uniref:Alpha/Beta hydrolase protein n=1 Tax=Roridomyces roridus TaxID=1738132 RepID=A0AAD7BHE8_9AGAR|nr:Alpha/Beta hydrolase protein [Roridomyces roridus]
MPHPWSLKYLRLWIITKLLRAFLRFQKWRVPLPPYNNPKIIRTEQAISSRDSGRSIRARWYRPASVASDQVLPVLINVHGSGYVIPMFGQDEPFCEMVAERAQCLVIDADYRKAPEYPFPLPSEDIEDVALYVVARIPHSTLSLSGWSAGGNLALGVAALLGPERVRSLVLFYPATSNKDRDGIPPESRMDSGSPIPPWMLHHFYDSYIVPGTPLANQRLSPDLTPTNRLPPHVWAVTGTADPLYPAAAALMARLQRDGHPDAVFRSLPYAGHGFVRGLNPAKPPDPRSEEVYDEAVAFFCKSIE